MTPVDKREMRNCFGKFATGITIITALAPDGTKLGLTVNSFSSLSLEPPMILWSLDKRSNNLEALKSASHFAVNVLASDQIELSNRFASPSDEKYQGVELVESKCDLPLFSGAVAHLECKNVDQHDGGDHVIFVGEVEYFTTFDKKPLLYANGQYAVAGRHPATPQAEPKVEDRTSRDDFIIPLLLRSYWEISEPFYNELMEEGIPVSHARILVYLSHTPDGTVRELSEATHIDVPSVAMSVKWLCDNGHLEEADNEKFVISELGLSRLEIVSRRAKRFEDEILDGYSEQEVDVLKSMLRKLIYRKDL